jgi:hypothetical protein
MDKGSALTGHAGKGGGRGQVQIRRCRVERRRQPALDVGTEQAGSFACLVKAPALARHAGPPARLGLGERAVTSQGSEGFAKTPDVAVSLEPGHGPMMAPTGSGSEDRFVSGAIAPRP